MKGRGGGCRIPTLLSLENAHVEYLLKKKKKDNKLILDLVMVGLITVTSSDDFPEFREVGKCFQCWSDRTANVITLLGSSSGHKSKCSTLVLQRGQKDQVAQTSKPAKLSSGIRELLFFPQRIL